LRKGVVRGGVSEDVGIAQIVTAITTVFYAAVFAIGYSLIIRGIRQLLAEMRRERLSGGRPQVIVEMGLLNLPDLKRD
jgi:predicted phage tail protein